MDVVRQNRQDRLESYHLQDGKDAGWKFKYTEFSYPEIEDRPRGAVRASLVIEEFFKKEFPFSQKEGTDGSFNDVFYLKFDGKISLSSDVIRYSPALERLEKLDGITLSKIRGAFSEKARQLFDRGLGEYEGY